MTHVNCSMSACFNLQEMQIDEPSMAMAARSITYNWPWLIQLMPPALVAAGHATVASGRAARRWLRPGKSIQQQ